MAEDKVQFSLDLDIKEFTEKGLQAKGIIEQIGKAEGLSGLLEGMVATTAVLGTVGIALFALKEAFDLTMEGESIQRINDQFEILTTQSGIATDKLKKGLIDSSKGLVDDTDLLKIANGAIVSMGKSAERLPELMDLATKSTQVFGGSVKENFQRMIEAIQSGRTQTLKQMGIVIDTNKAIQEYAKSHGIAANELSQAARNQAILNEVIAHGKQSLGDVKVDLDEATNTWEIFKVTLSNITEVFITLFDKTIGPYVRTGLTALKDFAVGAKQYLEAEFGGALEKSNYQVQKTESQLTSLKAKLDALKSGGDVSFLDKIFGATREAQIKSISSQINETEKSLETLRATNQQIAQDDEKQTDQRRSNIQKIAQESLVDKQKRLSNEEKFQKDLQQLDQNTAKLQQENVDTLEEVEKLANQQALVDEQVHQQKLTQIRNDASLRDDQKLKLAESENLRFHQVLRAQETQTEQLREKLLQNYVKNSDKAFAGIGKAFHVAALKAKADWEDFGKRGNQVVQSFQTYSTAAFEQIGQSIAQGSNVAESAANAMKGFFLNMLADRAIGEGELLLLSGIWPPNPVALTAGAGLITLGGALRTLAGGSGTTVGGAVGGGVGTSGIGVATSAAPNTGASTENVSPTQASNQAVDNMSAMQTEQKTVNVQIAGNYFDTDTTRKQLMEMIRQETDATDFSYNKIGV